MFRFRRLLAFLLLSLIVPAFAQAQIPGPGIADFQPPPDRHWGELAAADARAAYAFLLDNHPAGAAELHDTGFRGRLDATLSLALQRAAEVHTLEGYDAVMAGFAGGMGDKHIWSRPAYVVNTPWWAGILAGKRGDAWVVVDTAPEQAALKGARLTACDGQPIEVYARARLSGFHGDWNVGAQQAQAAPWLFVDEANPFAPRPGRCTFTVGQSSREVTLEWTRIKREVLLPRLRTAIGAGAAGFGLRRAGPGWWIALQSLSGDEAAGVVAQVRAHADELRAAPFVVLDLRGNGGGSSLIGRDIAAALYGKAEVEARLGPAEGGGCEDLHAWRVSDGNIENVQFLHDTLGRADPETGALLQGELAKMRKAKAEGRAFSDPISCPAAAPRRTPAPAAATPVNAPLKPRVVLVTDGLCFSSCLLVVDDFRTLGALQVGQTTDAATHYLEVREAWLPSGYSMMSTLQAVTDPTGPPAVGPFRPEVSYDGDIADTAKLEPWVIATAQARTAGR